MEGSLSLTLCLMLVSFFTAFLIFLLFDSSMLCVCELRNSQIYNLRLLYCQCFTFPFLFLLLLFLRCPPRQLMFIKTFMFSVWVVFCFFSTGRQFLTRRFLFLSPHQKKLKFWIFWVVFDLVVFFLFWNFEHFFAFLKAFWNFKE